MHASWKQFGKEGMMTAVQGRLSEVTEQVLIFLKGNVLGTIKTRSVERA